jgi:hypothetical protein
MKALKTAARESGDDRTACKMNFFKYPYVETIQQRKTGLVVPIFSVRPQ